MTETEAKALALLNEFSDYEVPDLDEAQYSTAIQALCRAIEQHEAFKREVSDAIELNWSGSNFGPPAHLVRFIIAKPDPLVEALLETFPRANGAEGMAADLRAAIEARGGRIVWEGE